VIALPVHPLTSANGLRIAAGIDGKAPTVLDFATHGRSDEWKNKAMSPAIVEHPLALP